MTALGNDFKVLIANLGLSPEEFADKIGVGKSAVYKVIRGETKKVSAAMARKIIAQFPQVSMDDLLNHKSSKVSENPLIINGVTITMDQIAAHSASDEEAFLSHKYFSNLIDLKVMKKLNELLRNPDKLDNFLNS